MTSEQARFLLDYHVPSIEQEWGMTKKVIEAIPEQKKDYRPEPRARTAFDLAWHIAATELWFVRAIINGEFSMDDGGQPDDVKTVADVGAWYEKNVPPALAKLRALPDKKLATPLVFFGLLNEPAVKYLNFLVVHTVHHRGQLSTYLRPMGSKVPSIYGGSADEPFEMPS